MRKKENKTEKIIEDLDKRQDVEMLEKFYITGMVDNLPTLVNERKNNIVEEILNYRDQHSITKYDKDGNEVGKIVNVPPFVVANYFFRSITNLQNIEPKYNGEQLSILWDLYTDIVINVNLHLCEFTPTMSHFCRYIGVTTAGFRKMKDSPDEGIRVIANKIFDALYDENVKMAELNKHNPRATTFRMKSEMGVVEKEAPKVIVNTTTVDIDEINKRIASLAIFNKAQKDLLKSDE